ncbi:MAG: hypothetical protein LUI87_16910 [Lachnospiraceae bacterium]|nr:hypothetical protein [Lachnospiraceae bacterium]
MKKRTHPAAAAAILMITGLIVFGILLTVKHQNESLPSDADYQQTQNEAASLLDELGTITGFEKSTNSETGTGSDKDSSDRDASNGDPSDNVSSNSNDSDGAAVSAVGANTVSNIATEASDFDSDSEAETEPDTEWVLELLALNDTPVIWVGDSRTVGMQKALGSYTKDVFIGAAGEGYSWLYETGTAQLETAISEYPGRPVIFNMGVNDYENLYNYMVLYEELTMKYPDTIFWFLSVNPVDDDAGLYVTNAQIEEFNASLAAAYPDTWLDSYSFLMESNAGTIDGIHYSEEVYRMIYLFAKEALSDKI